MLYENLHRTRKDIYVTNLIRYYIHIPSYDNFYTDMTMDLIEILIKRYPLCKIELKNIINNIVRYIVRVRQRDDKYMINIDILIEYCLKLHEKENQKCCDCIIL